MFFVALENHVTTSHPAHSNPMHFTHLPPPSLSATPYSIINHFTPLILLFFTSHSTLLYLTTIHHTHHPILSHSTPPNSTYQLSSSLQPHSITHPFISPHSNPPQFNMIFVILKAIKSKV